MHLTIDLHCPVFDSFRVQQVAGMFDIPLAEKLREQFTLEIPDDLLQPVASDPSSAATAHCQPPTTHSPWQLGLLVGPSGSGKTTLARELFGNNFIEQIDWAADRAVIDCFDLPVIPPRPSPDLRSHNNQRTTNHGQRTSDKGQTTRDHGPTIHQITSLLTAVGFSSPPSWIKPYNVLSGGERFRCDLARALAASLLANRESIATDHGQRTTNQTLHSDHSAFRTPNSAFPLIAFDEFTSVVDRHVARIGSAAVAKAVRTGQIPCRFVAVTCHYDILDWLCPDWIIDMATRQFTWYNRGDRQELPVVSSPSSVVNTIGTQRRDTAENNGQLTTDNGPIHRRRFGVRLSSSASTVATMLSGPALRVITI